MKKNRAIAGVFAIFVVMERVLQFICIPLFLDALKFTTTTMFNISNANHTGLIPLHGSRMVSNQIDVYFTPLINSFFVATFFGIVLLAIRILMPSQLSEADRNYPVSSYAVAGVAMGVSTLLFMVSSPGSRTAPYIQALVLNLLIPNQFIVRFIILRKRPTPRKAVCALVVLVAELICIIPSVFPQLESEKAKTEEGGASGAARVLWPIAMMSSQFPFAAYNSFVEKAVHTRRMKQNDTQQLNTISVMFWTNLFTVVTLGLLFWVDLIPGYGTCPSIHVMGQLFLFNIRCMLGLESQCRFPILLYGWGRVFLSAVGPLVQAYLMRYSEGANFMVIILTFRTPLLFIFWTLFQENPFQWLPHVHLSTWLSIGAIAVMVPATIIYSTGPPENSSLPKHDRHENNTTVQTSENEACDERPLLHCEQTNVD